MTGIQLSNLTVTFQLPGGAVTAVDHVEAEFPGGEITGIIGESGCGKSVLGLALLGLLPPYARRTGTIRMDGVEVTAENARGRLGREVGLVPQNPDQSLNPARTVAAHLYEGLLPLRLGRGERRERARQLLRDFGFEDPERILRCYPHQLSGGMQQRVLCAVGTACAPRWVLADEPTKGLDSALRGQVRDNLLSLRERGVESMLVITHDLPLAKELCRQVAVMYGGQILELGEGVLDRPLHPYTRAFLNALPERGFQSIPGLAPRGGERQGGCPFAPRCPRACRRCREERPEASAPEPGRMVRCFLYG